MKHVSILKLRENVSKKDLKKSQMNGMVENWKGKQMYGQFIRDMPESTDKEKPWVWLRKCDLKKRSEALICSAQEQAIRTNYVKYHIDECVHSPSCRMWGETSETVSHIVSECSKLAQREYKGMAMLLEWFIGNCVRNSILKSLKNGFHTILKLLVKMLNRS